MLGVIMCNVWSLILRGFRGWRDLDGLCLEVAYISRNFLYFKKACERADSSVLEAFRAYLD